MCQPLAMVAMVAVIIGAIVGTGCLIWWLFSGDLHPSTIKRDNPGRRRSDR